MRWVRHKASRTTLFADTIDMYNLDDSETPDDVKTLISTELESGVAIDISEKVNSLFSTAVLSQ